MLQEEKKKRLKLSWSLSQSRFICISSSLAYDSSPGTRHESKDSSLLLLSFSLFFSQAKYHLIARLINSTANCFIVDARIVFSVTGRQATPGRRQETWRQGSHGLSCRLRDNKRRIPCLWETECLANEISQTSHQECDYFPITRMVAGTTTTGSWISDTDARNEDLVQTLCWQEWACMWKPDS